MRDYAKLAPTFWAGATGKALRKCGSEAVIAALYLVSAPGSNMLGLYYQPLLYMAHETGLGPEGASKGLQACIDVGFCSYDEDTEMVFVHEMAAWQIADVLPAKDLRCKGIQRDYDALPDCPFLGAWFDRYSEAFHLTRRRGSGEDEEAPSKPLRSQEQEQEQEQEQKPSLLPQAPALPPEDRQAAAADGPQLHLVDPPAPRPAGPPDCPHLEVLALWAEVLPAMPQHLPSQWRGARADHLRARWRETAVEKAWTDQAQGLAYLRKLFAYVGQSAFLTGRTAARDPGKRPFLIELEWLVNPTNWAKVIEGKYHTEAA